MVSTLWGVQKIFTAAWRRFAVTPPQWLHSSARWHMKDNGHSYLFQIRYFLILGIIGVLDYIRLDFKQ